MTQSSDVPETTTIREIRDETRTIRSFVLDAEIEDAEPGQFIMLWLPGVDEKPMSIVSPAPLTISVARVGPFSTALHRRREGDPIGWRGPYGRGFRLDSERRALLIAGGCGGAPLYFLAQRAVEANVPTTVAVGARTVEELLFVERFRALGADVIIATDDGTEGVHGPVTEAAQPSLTSDGDPPVVYACGPERMLAVVHQMCLEHGVEGQLSLERYMKCGFGICGQCALDDLLVCKDGPIFTVEELVDNRDFGKARRSATGRRLPLR